MRRLLPYAGPIVLLAALCFFVVGIAVAQTADDAGKPIHETTCSKLAIQALRAATDPAKVAQQDWNLKAAQAYRELAELGQSC